MTPDFLFLFLRATDSTPVHHDLVGRQYLVRGLHVIIGHGGNQLTTTDEQLLLIPYLIEAI